MLRMPHDTRTQMRLVLVRFLERGGSLMTALVCRRALMTETMAGARGCWRRSRIRCRRPCRALPACSTQPWTSQIRRAVLKPYTPNPWTSPIKLGACYYWPTSAVTILSLLASLCVILGDNCECQMCRVRCLRPLEAGLPASPSSHCRAPRLQSPETSHWIPLALGRRCGKAELCPWWHCQQRPRAHLSSPSITAWHFLVVMLR